MTSNNKSRRTMKHDTEPIMDRIIDIFRGKEDFVIVSHEHPDGDGIGSQLGLGHVLTGLGKTVRYLCFDPVPEELSFLPMAEQIESVPPEVGGETVLVIVDAPSPKRIRWPGEGPPLESVSATINIDHHISNTCYAAYNWVDPKASCVGEMLCRLFKKGGFVVDRAAAECLYASILTDTGGFRYCGTSADTFEAAAELVRKGADPSRIATNIYSSMPPAKYRLLHLALETLRLCNNSIGVMRVTREMFKKAGANTLNSDGFVNYPYTLKGARIAMLLKELADRTGVKVSLRSKTGEDDVNKIAQKFGGGGHPTASGCTVEGTIAEVEQAVVAEAEKIINHT